MFPSFVNDLPPVEALWKGGVASVLDGTNLCYYGLAKVGETNGWVNLEGPPPIFNGGPVRLRMTVRSLDGGNAVVTYEIGGETYMFDGHSEIPVVVSSSLVGAESSGEGRILSLGGTRVKATSELSLIVR